jgi:acyl carrier protein
MKLSGLFEIIEDALELDAGSVTMDSSSENIEDWDSLGHITILGMLDDETSGESADIVDLTQAASVTEIAQILTDNGLLEQ